MTQEKVQEIALEQLVPDEQNRMVGGFDQKKLEQLADSIKAVGVQQPAVVRLIHGPDGAPDTYEIVAGERRWRASKVAGRPTLPCLVRDLDDLTVLKIRGIENLQREDVHPLDEANWYGRLLEQGGYDVETLAAEVGKSASYVYQRLKLKDLSEPARAAFVDGTLSAGHAILIARLSPDGQEQVMKEALDLDYKGNGPSVKELAEWIQEQLFMELSKVSWKLDDSELLPTAGSCLACPKRTGSRPEMFADVCKDKKDYCTDRACFAEKSRAMVERQREALGEDKHLEVRGGYGQASKGALSRYDWTECRKKDKGAQRVLVVEGLGAGRLTWGKKNTSYQPSARQEAQDKARRAAEARKRALALAYPRALWERVVPAVAKKLAGGTAFPEGLLRLVVLHAWDRLWDNHKVSLCRQEGWEQPPKEKSNYGHGWKQAGDAQISKAKKQDLPLLLVKLLLIGELDAPMYSSTWKPEALEACAKLVRVDCGAVKSAVQAEARLKEKVQKAREKTRSDTEDAEDPEDPEDSEDTESEAEEA